MTKKLRPLVTASLLLVFVISAHVPAAFAAQAEDKPKTATCAQQVSLVKYRSDLLKMYQKSDHAKYKTLRQKWVTRITYANQWVPEDARKARESLYKYDTLHTQSFKELDKQIKASAKLNKAAIGCSGAQKAVLKQKLTEIRGVKAKQVVGGNALISQNKRQETTFLNNEFKKSSDVMMHNLRKAKATHPTPQYKDTFEIKSKT